MPVEKHVMFRNPTSARNGSCLHGHSVTVFAVAGRMFWSFLIEHFETQNL